MYIKWIILLTGPFLFSLLLLCCFKWNRNVPHIHTNIYIYIYIYMLMISYFNDPLLCADQSFILQSQVLILVEHIYTSDIGTTYSNCRTVSCEHTQVSEAQVCLHHHSDQTNRERNR